MLTSGLLRTESEVGRRLIALQVIPLAIPDFALSVLLRQFGSQQHLAFDGDPATEQAFTSSTAPARASYELLSGHFHFGIDENQSVSATYVTLLRDPVACAADFYYLVLASPTHYLYQELTGNKWSLHDFIAAQRPEIDNPFVRWLNPRTTPWLPFGAVTSAMLATAKRNLAQRYILGLSERLDETLLYLSRVFGWDAPYYSDLGTLPPARTGNAIAPETVELIRQINGFDLELYEFAQSCFEERLTAVCPDHAAEVESFRAENQRRAISVPRVFGVPLDLRLPAEEPVAKDIIWLASYPRSGNTWLRFLLDSYFFPPARHLMDVGRLSLELDYWLKEADDRGLPRSWTVMVGRHLQREHPRPPGCPTDLFFKSHFARTERHPLIERSRAAIYLLRNPRGVLLSGLNFAHLTRDNPPGDDGEYAKAFVAHGGDAEWLAAGYGSWQENLQSWLCDAPFPVLPVVYRNLKNDTAGQFRRVLEFLGVAVDETRLEVAVANAGFQRLRNLEIASRATSEMTDLRDRQRHFFHKGVDGQSLAHLGAEVEEAFNLRFAEDMRRWGFEA